MVAFALQATVADVGSHPPSDLYLVDRDSDTPVPISNGAWSDRSPAWSLDGARLAFLSDRITQGHPLPYTMAVGDEPMLAANLRASPIPNASASRACPTAAIWPGGR
jgi:Tol biopolymer transport system component